LPLESVKLKWNKYAIEYEIDAKQNNYHFVQNNGKICKILLELNFNTIEEL
jgi:hypothetical protein